MKDMKMTIELKCAICGNDQFSMSDEKSLDMNIKCSDCGRTVTKEEFLEENQYIIDANIKDFKEDVVRNIKKNIKKIFK